MNPLAYAARWVCGGLVSRRPSPVCICGFGTLVLLVASLLLGRHAAVYGRLSSSDLGQREGMHRKDEEVSIRRPEALPTSGNKTIAEPLSPGQQRLTEEAIQREQGRRRRVLDEACRRLNLSRTDPGDTSRLIVNDPHRILFKFVPKVSCSTWKKVWRKLRSRASTPFVFLGQYPAEERAFRLATYRKVLFTRDPMSRLLSAYLSKFHAIVSSGTSRVQHIWEKAYGRDIVKRYRGLEMRTLPNDTFLNITLVEFMRYVTDRGPAIRMTAFSDHWLPQSRIATPCQLRYDFIGRFEELHAEGPYVLKWLGVDHLVTFPDYHASKAVGNLVEFYRQVPLDLIKRVTEYYRQDYALFGYSLQTSMETLMRSLFYEDDDEEPGSD